MMKKVLVTGGAGYIGSHTVLELARSGNYEIVVFDDLANGNRRAIEIISEATGVEIELCVGSLLERDAVLKVFSKHQFDYVIHFAALIEAGKSVIHPTVFYENNVIGTLNLIHAMQKNGVGKLVFSSTAAVYGTPEVERVTENSPLRPESAYGESKLIVENILRSLSHSEVDVGEKVDSVILRYFNAAGADPELLIGQDYPNPTHLITRAVEVALGLREDLVIFGDDYDTPDRTCIRDYIHVSDLAMAHVKALGLVERLNGSDVFNLGTGKGMSNLEVVREIEKINGKFDWGFGPRRPGDPVAFHADPAKAKAQLDWEAKYTSYDAIKDAYNWVKKYPHGFTK